MSERASLRERAETARKRVRVPWDDARTAHLAQRARARQRRRTIVRGSAASVVTLTAVALLGWIGLRAPTSVGLREPSIAMARPDAAPSGVLHLYDGSTVTPIDDDTEVVVSEVNESAIVLELRRGAARFEVTPGLRRGFRVQAGTVTVSVVGTVFAVRREGEGASVDVEEGRVRVAWEPGRSAIIGAGEHGVFPREDEISATAEVAIPSIEGPAADPAITPAPREPLAIERDAIEREERTPSVRARLDTRGSSAERTARGSETRDEETAIPSEDPAAARGWRALAEQGLFDEGYGLLLADPRVLPSRDVEALMAGADVARLSGHPAESLAYLHRALEVGQGDPRAPMVAFTLGRVLLQQLGRPADAADAFARCRTLAPQGSLASDALAREVEAWHRAGELERARGLALEYLRLHPHGLRASAVRHYGGLE